MEKRVIFDGQTSKKPPKGKKVAVLSTTLYKIERKIKMKNQHYVYKITNNNPTDMRKYYIGVRTAENCSPEEDLGYMGSSESLNEAIRESGLTHFSKEILSTWASREEANLEEIRLHWELNVAGNPEYYNKANATSSGFCMKGSVTVIDSRTGKTKAVSKEDFDNHDYYVHIATGKVTIIDETGIRRNVSLEEYNNNPKLTHNRAGQVPVIDTRTGKTKSVSKEDFEKYDYYVHSTTGQVTVIDIRDGNTKNVSKEDFEKYDYYVHNTTGQVTVTDAYDNITKNISVEEYHSNKDRYATSCKGKVVAIHKISKSKMLMTKNELEKNNEYEIFTTKGLVAVRDMRDNSTKNVSQEDYQKYDYYVAFNTGKVNVIDLRDNKTKQVSKEEFDKHDYYQSVLVGQTTVFDTRDGKRKNVSQEDYHKYDYYQSLMDGKITAIDTRDGSCVSISKELFDKCEYYVSSRSKKIGIFDKSGDLKYTAWGNFKQVCKLNGLPCYTLAESLRHGSNPIPLSTAKNAITKFINSGYESYIGWYAKEIA